MRGDPRRAGVGSRRSRVRRDRCGASAEPRCRDHRHGGQASHPEPSDGGVGEGAPRDRQADSGCPARDAADDRRHNRPERLAPGDGVPRGCRRDRDSSDEARRHGQGRHRARDRPGARRPGKADRDRGDPRGPAPVRSRRLRPRVARGLMARGEGTRVVRAGLPAPAQGEPFLPGPTFAAPYHLVGNPEDAPYVYGRYGNPTWTLYERALEELEEGPAVVFASGMAAAAAVLLPLLSRGDVLVIPEDGYPAVRRLAIDHLMSQHGVEVRQVPSSLHPDHEALDGARLVWLESPSNPGLEVSDIRAVVKRTHDGGGLVAVDNTLATPLGQRPLELGADFSMSSDSKHLTGHGDLILGHVACADPDRAAELVAWRTQAGSVPGPFEVWLAHRSLATLELRLGRQCATALALAERLVYREDLTEVRYPGLPGDSAHQVARHQMSRYGSLISFVLENRDRAERFLAECRLVIEATSFGSIHTMAERRARWPGTGVPEGFIRLSVGCEDTDDLIEDVERALDASAR